MLYEEEVELNTRFNQFVLNYKAAYEGRNSRSDQIIDGSIAKNENLRKQCRLRTYCIIDLLSFLPAYSDFLDEEMTKPGPNYLPLGRCFQEHVALFK